MIALTRLAEKVEAGTATDADFDATWPRAMNGEHHHAKTAYNGSLDAAMALHDAVLPGWRWGLHEPRPLLFRANVSPYSALRPMPYTAEHTDPARVWLIAILRALAAGKTP